MFNTTHSAHRRRWNVAALTMVMAWLVSLPSVAMAVVPVPQNLHVKAYTRQQVALGWQVVSGATSYKIYRDGTQVASPKGEAVAWVDPNLTIGSTHSYTIAAVTPSGTSAQSAPVTQQLRSTAVGLSGCSSTAYSGSAYVLTADISLSGTTPCLTFNNAAGTSLDCQGHTITSYGTTATAVILDGVSHGLVTRCSFIKFGTTKSVALDVVGGDENVVFGNSMQRSNIVDTGIRLVTSTNAAVIGNGLNDHTIIAAGSDGSYFQSNTIVSDSTDVTAGMLGISYSNDITIARNTIDGGWAGPGAGGTGADDAIIVSGANDNMSVIANTLRNVWDAGFEASRSFTNSRVIGNVISGSGNAGIGGWRGMTWQSNTVADNTISNAVHAFDFFATGASSLQNGATSFTFTDNTFTNNTFTSPYSTTEAAAVFDLATAWGSSTPIVASGNVFTGNTFPKTMLTPLVNPASLVLSASGNTCTVPTSGPNPLNCT